MCRELEALRQSICDYATSFDAGSLIPAQAARIVTLCAGIEASVATVKSLAATVVAQGSSWKAEGFRSAEEQLADRTGIGTTGARRALQTGRRMADQPEVAQAALAGELSPEQAALVAAGVEADSSKAAQLIDKAKHHSLGELRDEVAQVRAASVDLEEQHRRIHAARKLRHFVDLEGVWHLMAAGNVADGVTITKLLTPIRQRLDRLRRDSGQERQTFEQLEYDALVALADIASGRDGELTLADLLDLGLFSQLETTLEGLTADPPAQGGPWVAGAPAARAFPGGPAGGPGPAAAFGRSGDISPRTLFDRSGAPDPGPPDPSSPDPAAVEPSLREGPPAAGSDGNRRAPRPGRWGRKLAGRPVQVIIRVDLDTLLRGVPVEGELCEIPGYGPVPVSVVKELMANGSAFVSALLTKSKAVCGVYRFGRRPNVYQQTALDFLYPCCAVKGCHRTAGLEYEHREDWHHTHFTVYDLMDRLCWFHHQQKTNAGWNLVEGVGPRDFVPPTDPRHPKRAGGRRARSASADGAGP